MTHNRRCCSLTLARECTKTDFNADTRLKYNPMLKYGTHQVRWTRRGVCATACPRLVHTDPVLHTFCQDRYMHYTKNRYTNNAVQLKAPFTRSSFATLKMTRALLYTGSPSYVKNCKLLCGGLRKLLKPSDLHSLLCPSASCGDANGALTYT